MRSWHATTFQTLRGCRRVHGAPAMRKVPMARARRAGQGVPAMHKGPTVAPLFEVHTVIDEILGDVCQSLDLLSRAIAGSGDESLDFPHGGGKVFQCPIEIGSASVEHAGQRCEAVLELDDLCFAVA